MDNRPEQAFDWSRLPDKMYDPYRTNIWHKIGQTNKEWLKTSGLNNLSTTVDRILNAVRTGQLVWREEEKNIFERQIYKSQLTRLEAHNQANGELIKTLKQKVQDLEEQYSKENRQLREENERLLQVNRTYLSLKTDKEDRLEKQVEELTIKNEKLLQNKIEELEKTIESLGRSLERVTEENNLYSKLVKILVSAFKL